MKQKIVVAVIFLSALAAQDRFTLKAPNGIAFSEFKGYEAWPTVAPSQPDDGIKIVTANPVMIKAYKEGFPGNGKAVPDGAMMAKIEWTKKASEESPYSVQIPDTLKRVGLMVKDSK